MLGHDLVAQHDPVEGTRFFLYDGHGNTRILYDSKAVNLQSYRYDAFGKVFGGQEGAVTNHLYSGEYMDKATGLQYLRARYYDPSIGRFNRLDPYAGNIYDPQSLHKYLYCHGDPVNLIDLLGLKGEEYNLITGTQVHILFYAKYKLIYSQSGEIFVDRAIKSIVDNDYLNAIFSLKRPDFVVKSGAARGFYELKPISHSTCKNLAIATDVQMAIYDIGLRSEGITRGDSKTFLGSFKSAGGFIRWNKQWWQVTYYSSTNKNQFGHDTRGLIYYSLKPWQSKTSPPGETLFGVNNPDDYRMPTVQYTFATLPEVDLTPVFASAAIAGGAAFGFYYGPALMARFNISLLINLIAPIG